MTSTPPAAHPRPLPLIVLAWLVAGVLLAGGVVLAMLVAQQGNQVSAVAVLLGSLAGYGFVQRIALISAHDWADARRPHHRDSDQHRRPPSTLPPLVTPPRGLAVPVTPLVGAHDATGPIAAERDVTALASAVGIYKPRHGCDTDTTVIPAIAAGQAH